MPIDPELRRQGYPIKDFLIAIRTRLTGTPSYQEISEARELVDELYHFIHRDENWKIKSRIKDATGFVFRQIAPIWEATEKRRATEHD